VNNTTGNEDTIIGRVDKAPSLQDLVEIIQRLDDELTNAKDELKASDEALSAANDRIAILETEKL